METPALEIVIATRNSGKVREIQKLLHGLGVRLRSLDDFAEVSPVDEVGNSYEENAILKALGYAQQTGLCALADDSGLEVDALDGRPGVYSARFGGGHLSDKQRTAKLLESLSNYPESKRAARFVCAMAFAGRLPEESQSPEPQILNITKGTCEGLIAMQPRGENGFGFDPVFVPLGHHQTFAELSNEVKDTISHRAKALAEMRTFLRGWVASLDRLSGHP